jgi:hypothetical protein
MFIFGLVGSERSSESPILIRWQAPGDVQLQNSVAECGVDSLDPRIRRQNETPNEDPGGAFHAQTLLPALQHCPHPSERERSPIHAHLDFLLLQTREVELKQIRLV